MSENPINGIPGSLGPDNNPIENDFLQERRAISKKRLDQIRLEQDPIEEKTGANQIFLECKVTDFLLEQIEFYNSKFLKSFQYSLVMVEPPSNRPESDKAGGCLND